VELLETRMVLAAPHPFDLASLLPENGGNGSAGVTLFGVDQADQSGAAVHHIGDMNGDGFDDVLVGAYRSGGPASFASDAGKKFVFFGMADWSATPPVELATLNGSNGFTIQGGYRFVAVSSAGDVNGDGFDDLLLGTPYGRGAGDSSFPAGESYVVFGKADWTSTPTIDLGKLNGSNGFTLFGVGRLDDSGRAVSAAGDVNGDGFDDLLVGAWLAEDALVNQGESYVVFGRSDWSPTLNLASLNGFNGFTLVGADAYDLSGNPVSAAGDVNGDGFDDLLIAAQFADRKEMRSRMQVTVTWCLGSLTGQPHRD
jgi:hypothetical protein